MSASSIPLKIKNVDGDLQELSPSEEMYLSVKVGEALAESSAGDIGDLSLTDGTNIGSFVDTHYNEPSGTHPLSAITGTTVTTTLKQVGGSAIESDSNFVRPVGYYEVEPNPGFYEMVDSDLDNLTNRALKNLETLGLQGTFQLSETSPGGDWAKHIDSVFTDTHGDGNSTVYHIWKKISLATPPVSLTTVRPVATDYDDTSSFSGFKEMSDDEIKYTLGQRAKSLRSTAGEIGSYQLRSSAQGAPTLAGTWAPRGSALNTQRSIIDTDYTRTRNSTYTRNSIGSYTREIIEDYSGTYTNTFTGNSEVTFTGNYTSGFVGNFVGNYARVSVNNSTRTRYSSYAADYAADYITIFSGNYIGNSSSDFSASYVRGFVGNFTGNYARSSTRSSIGTTTYVGDFTRSRANTLGYVRSAFYTRTSTTTSTGTTLSYFVGGTSHSNPGFGAIALDPGGGYMYWSHFFDTGSSTHAWWANRNKGSGPSGATSITSSDGYTYYRGPFHSVTGATGAVNLHHSSTANHYRIYRARLVTPSYTSNFTGNFSIAEYYTRTYYYTGNYVRGFLRNTHYYTGNFTGNYSRNQAITRNSSYTRTRTSTYTSDYVGNYAGIFTGNYTGNYSREYVNAFTGNYTSEYTRTSERTRVSAYVLERVSTYTRDRTSTYDGTYSRGFTGNYTGENEFTGNYSSPYIGNYIGATLSDTSNSTTETYTLYVRVA